MSKNITSQLVQGKSQIKGLTVNSQGNTRQVISIMDVLCEGPVKGLVNNQHSVFFNDEKFADEVDNIEGGALFISYTQGSTTVTGVPDLSADQGTFFVFTVRAVDTQTVNVLSINFDRDPQPFYNSPKGIILRGTGGFTENSKYFARVTSGTRELARIILQDGTSVKGYLKYHASGYLDDEVLFIPLSLTSNKQRELEIKLAGAVDFQTVTLEVDYEIIYRSNTQVLGTNFPFPSGSYRTDLSERAYRTYGGIKTGEQGPSAFLSLRNIDSSSLEFRPGTEDQEPIEGPGGIGNISITASINEELTKFEEGLSDDSFTLEDESPIVNLTTSKLNISPEQVSEIDEVRISFSYDSLVAITKTGTELDAGAVYSIKLITYTGGTEATGTPTIANEIMRIHSGNSTVPISFEELIFLNNYRPFQDFKIVVERLKRHNGARVFPNGSDGKKKVKLNANCNITSATSIIKERFSYPYTAHANVTFSSVDYTETPSRTYEIYGKLVKVPSNYTTREEGDGLNATYTGFWDGEFKKDLRYTDNPAWVFYDILTNNNYGLGNWISEDDIDKYSLYRIAKYCDELVPDGKGGLEPRFRSNIYLAKQADAYKVLKDMASVFLGMLYWMDGQVVAVHDEKKDPLFTFAKANVIEGAFSYENTGSKTRSNQVVVTWNNPEESYAAETLLVEDRENIISTGKIIKEEVVAFGCTSRAQAYRYGVWKLWTAKNQTEIVSFETSIDAAFLAPGDIIRIQDADRFNSALSGRLKSMISSTELQLDRQVYLDSEKTYEVSITLTDPTTETAENLSEGAVEELKVENVSFTVDVSSTYSTITLPTPFETLPEAGAVWVLKEFIGDAQIAGSAKDYRILSSIENSKNNYGITAVEYYPEKFDSVYGELNLYQIEDIFPDYTNNTKVYKPGNIYLSLNSDPAKKGDEFKVLWDSPVDLDLNIPSDIAGFEIYHNISNYDSPIRVKGGVRSYSFSGVLDGPYSVAIRTVNTSGFRSDFSVINFDVEDKFRLNVPRDAEGVGIGGIVGAPLKVDGSVLKFVDGTADITNPGIATIVNPTEVITANISTLDLSSLADNTYQILLESGSTSLKPIIHKEVEGLGYWYVPGSEKTLLTGTLNANARKNFLYGTGTSFTTELAVGDVIYFDNLEKYAKITNILTDEKLIIDRSFDTQITGTFKKAGLTINFEEDSLVAKVVKAESTYILSSYLSLDSTILPRQFKLVSVYKKAATVETPTGGSYSDPVPTGWSIAPPGLSANGDIIYVSTRTFTSDGQEQDTIWSSPTIYSQRIDPVTVVIESSSNGFVFKNNSGAKTLTAKVYDGGTLLNTGIIYHWKRDGVTVNLDSATDKNVDMSEGTVLADGVEINTSSINVQADDIDIGGSNLFTCEVTVS